MHKIQRIAKFTLVSALLALIAGCADEPSGYLFTPTHRDKTFLTAYAGAFLSQLYTNLDEAGAILTSASLTNDYSSVLPEGWQRQVIGGDTLYLRNYNDEQFHAIRFDPNPTAGAVRIPASLAYDRVDIASFRNPLTNTFYGDTSQAITMTIQYSDNRTDPEFIDGWYQVQRPISVEYSVQIQVGGGTGQQTVEDYVMTTWQMKIERFSVESRDQRARISFNGTYPLIDRAGVLQSPQVAGEFTIERDGRGSGDIWLYGEKTSRVILLNRAYGFEGYFTLYEEDHSSIYAL